MANVARGLTILWLAITLQPGVHAQIPKDFKNLEYFPKDMSPQGADAADA
jgi:hypothetical protein